MKTAISVPNPIFKAADKLAGKLGLSRSELYARAVRKYIEEHDEKAVTAKLNELYERENSNLEPLLQSIQSRSVRREKWK